MKLKTLTNRALVCAFCAGMGLTGMAGELFTNKVLPKEGEDFKLVYVGDNKTGKVTINVAGVSRSESKKETLELKNGKAELALKFKQNGIYKAQAVEGGKKTNYEFPVIFAKRDVNIIYYGMNKDVWAAGDIRWATQVTAAGKNMMASFKARGVTPLKWNWGSNYLKEAKKQSKHLKDMNLSPKNAEAISLKLFSDSYKKAIKNGYEGFGLDEFGGYFETKNVKNTEGFVRGIIEARKDMPKDFKFSAWHAGPISPKLMGLYKQAVDFLLLESYLLDICPDQLGTEIMKKDMEGRLMLARSLDMFTAPYNSGAKIIPSVDLTDKIPVSEYEVFFRMMRREFPEVRGIAFFNVLKKKKENYKIVDQLCFDYYIRPVITFQPDSMSYDAYSSKKVIAYASNVGAMDSGKVILRLLVNGREVEKKELKSVPAGFSRLDNRTKVVFDWQPKQSGTYKLRVETVSAPNSTVLDPAFEISVFINK